MFPKFDRANQQILNAFQASTMGFWQPYPSHILGEYLVTLDLAQIALDPTTGLTPQGLPFGVNFNFQIRLDELAGKSKLVYFAPLHANGFAYRTPQPFFLLESNPPILPNAKNLWNLSKIDPALQALQWSLGNVEARRAAARSYLQHMVMRFSDPAVGEEAVASMNLNLFGILRIEPMAARHIPVAQPDSIGKKQIILNQFAEALDNLAPMPPTQGKLPSKSDTPKPLQIMPTWWEDGLGLKAWRSQKIVSTPRIQIAVLDTGCERMHPHLQPAQPNLIIQPFGDFLDRSGHGTHVCGILIAKEPPIGQPSLLMPQGIGPDLFSLRNYKVFADIQSGIGPKATWTAKVVSQLYISALDHLIGVQRAGADVRALNLSLCGPAPFSDSATDPELAKFKALLGLGVVAVAAAGNGNTMGPQVMYPACYREVISAGALQSYRPATNWQHSNVGRAYVDLIDKSQKPVDIYAPGAGITSSYVVVTGDFQNETRSARAAEMSGTSMAAPIVSAAVAIRSQRLAPTKTSAQNANNVLSWLQNQTSINLSSPDYKLP